LLTQEKVRNIEAATEKAKKILYIGTSQDFSVLDQDRFV